MHHGSYWALPPHDSMDVKHHDDVTNYHLPEGERTKVCTKTITYQLDGNVGLAADLALMAQAAALAREVSFVRLLGYQNAVRTKRSSAQQNIYRR